MGNGEMGNGHVGNGHVGGHGVSYQCYYVTCSSHHSETADSGVTENIQHTSGPSRPSDTPSTSSSGVGTYLSGTARAVPLLKVGRLVMHFTVPLFSHRLHIALMIDVSFIVT